MNRFLLDAKVKENGFTMEQISKELGIDEATFWRKKTGKSDFYRYEIQKLRKLLNLTSEQVDEIFFDH